MNKNIYDIPNLPVADLEYTRDLFLKWVEPLISKEDYEIAKLEWEKFISSDLSDKLQNVIIEKSKDKDNSWLYDWWLNYAYLASRGPVTTECNAPIKVEFDNMENYSQAERIALLFHATAKVYIQTKKHGVPNFEVKGTKLSLDQLETAFASIRTPGKDFDNFELFEGTSRHSIFMFKNRIYKVEVIDQEDNLINPSKIANALNEIINSNPEQLEVGLGHLSTFTNRNDLKDFYDTIEKEGNNKEVLKEINESIILVSYDDIDYEGDVVAELKGSVHTEHNNRFHGKTITYQVSRNGVSMIADHTPIDGGTELAIAIAINDVFAKGLTIEGEEISKIEELKQEITTEHSKVLEEEFNKFKEYVSNITVNIKPLNVKRSELTELGIVGVDSFIHLAFQLAQLDAWGKIRNTYIAVDVRNFYKGRTECIRPVSHETMNVINSIKEGNTSKEELKDMMKAVMDEHYARLKATKSGMGINRHMLGLQLALAENPELGEAPELFKTNAWTTISGNPISTSSLGHPIVKSGFFEPVDPNGIGILYVVDNINSYISVSAYQKDAKERDIFVERVEYWINELTKIYK